MPRHYTVEHLTRYVYETPVTQSWQLARMMPRQLPWQQLLSHSLQIEPPPQARHDTTDSFGNTVTHFDLYGAHRMLRVRVQSVVQVGERPVVPEVCAADAARAHDTKGQDSAALQSWESVRDTVRADPSLDDLDPARVCEPTMLVPLSDAARRYARASIVPGRDWLEALSALMSAIHRDFRFEPGTTTVSTSVDEVLQQRSGVCQDFAHLMLACLRGLGLPARYVSGYLLTEPPAGQARLLGVDASHAWVAAYSPRLGWVEFDPTNDTLADDRYITLAWGKDFADVAPLRGVILGGGEQQLDVEVSVVPHE